MGFLDLDLPCDIRDIIADVRNLAQADEIKLDMIAMLALDAIGLVPMIGALKYSDETAEAVASGEKLLKESGTIYESFADMMSPDDAAKYLDFLENGSKEGLTSAELAGVEKADVLLVSQKVKYEDVWDLRNAGDVLETSYGKSSGKIGDFTELEGSTVDEILDRIPDEAVLRELYPVQGGATEGFEFKWVQNGQTYRVRVHNVDPSAPVGSNAYNGWVVRAQRGRRYFDPTINDFREAKYFNPNGPDYDEVIINDTHIPILDPYQN